MKKVFLAQFQKRLFLASEQSRLSLQSLLKRKDSGQSMPIFTLLAKKLSYLQGCISLFWSFIMNAINGMIIYYGAVLVLAGEITVG